MKHANSRLRYSPKNFWQISQPQICVFYQFTFNIYVICVFYNLPFSTIFEDLLFSVKVQPSKFDPPMLSKYSVTFLTRSSPMNSKDILLIGSKDSSSSSHETMSNGYQKKFIAHLYFCRMRRTVKKVPDSYKYNLVWTILPKQITQTTQMTQITQMSQTSQPRICVVDNFLNICVICGFCVICVESKNTYRQNEEFDVFFGKVIGIVQSS